MVRAAEFAVRRATIYAQERMVLDNTNVQQCSAVPVSSEGSDGLCLSDAVACEAMRLLFEPVISIKTGEVMQVHVRIGWMDHSISQPTLDVHTNHAYPSACDERERLAVFVRVFEQTCRQVHHWSGAGLHTGRVFVHLPSIPSERFDTVSQIGQILVQTATDPHLLGMILGNTVLTDETEHASTCLKKLKAMGLELSVDDFGMDYCHLPHLRNLPLSSVMIPRPLLNDISEDASAVSVGRSLIDLAHGLHLTVLATGVESTTLLRRLELTSCDGAMGPCLSEPLDAHAFERRLSSGSLGFDSTRAVKDRQRTLLLVDDEENILSSLKRLFRRQGYNIIVATSGEEGLKRLKESHVDVIMSDQRMPGMTGIEFLRHAKLICPDTVRIVLSGYTELQSVTDAINEGAIYKFLTKPWDDELLRAQIEDAFRQKEMGDVNRSLNLQIQEMNHQLAKTNAQLAALVQAQGAELMRGEAKLLGSHDILDCMPIPLIGLDMNAALVFVNMAAENLLEITAGMVLGSPAEAVLPAELLMAVAKGVKDESITPHVHVGCHPYHLMIRQLMHEGLNRGTLIVLVPAAHADSREVGS